MNRTPRETSRRCMRLRWGGWRATPGSLPLGAGGGTDLSRQRSVARVRCHPPRVRCHPPCLNVHLLCLPLNFSLPCTELQNMILRRSPSRIECDIHTLASGSWAFAKNGTLDEHLVANKRARKISPVY